jgi:predicted RNA binding protein YcfA (HicA-like mRNA interferase family)
MILARNAGGLPRVVSQASARALLERNGWKMEIGGKHVIKMTKPGERPITLPYHQRQNYSVGLSQRILKQAGLKDETGSDEV